MTSRNLLAAAIGVAMLPFAATDALADYPDRAITMVVPFAAGGGGDTFTRAIAEQAQERLGVNVLVENRVGGGATIGVGSVARAAPDGYTIGFVSASPVVMAPNFGELPYDPSTDLAYVARFVTSPHPMLVPSGKPWQDFEELVAYMRENPGRLRWSTAAVRGAPHVATEALFATLGIEGTYIPMQGSSEVLAGLLGDTLDMGVISDFAVPLASGDIRVIAESGPERIAELPDVPTYLDLGSPLAPSIFFGIAGPSGMPDAVVSLWEEMIGEIVATDRFKDVAERLNANLAFLGYDEFHPMVLRDIAGMAEALEVLGMLDN